MKFRLPLPSRSGQWVACGTILIAMAATAGALFVWSGVYDVGARSGHFTMTRWLLEATLRQSVTMHSLTVEVTALDDLDLVRLGAAHFAGGCAPCHGSPGERQNAVVRSMLPQPPPLGRAARHWSDAQLFWIVRNGLKYTGMPAWAAEEREDEVWAVVAFLRQLSELDAEQYEALAAGNARVSERAPGDIARTGATNLALTACARCHDDENGNRPTSQRVPALAGQSPAYLLRALEEFARGARRSGIMQPVASALTEGEMRRLAAYYGGLNRVVPPRPAPEGLRRGRDIAIDGIPEQGLPPCMACHSGTAAGNFPNLYGQPARYLRQQLQLFREGFRNQSAYGEIMSAIARRLTDDDVADVTAYLAQIPRPLARTTVDSVSGSGN